MNELAAQGDTILMVSSELPEILAMSDRVLVMQGGRIRGELSRPRPRRSASWPWPRSPVQAAG